MSDYNSIERDQRPIEESAQNEEEDKRDQEEYKASQESTRLLEEAREEHHGRRQSAFSAGMRNHRDLAGAKEKLQLTRGPNCDSNVFAHDLPVRTKSTDEIEYSKSYLTGPYTCAFNYCQATSEHQKGVLLDEMTPTDRPVRLFFDLELKRLKHLTSKREHQEVCIFSNGVLKEHVVAAVEYEKSFNPDSSLEPSEECIERLLGRYVWNSRRGFGESVCRAGYMVMTDCIQQVLELLIGRDVVLDNKPWEEMCVSTRSRGDKFSLHIVMQDIYCDCASRSMPIIVFEIARHFTMHNIIWLLENEKQWTTSQGVFRMRCLMLESMQNDLSRFKGQSDSIFDEGVYSPGHLFSAPGACTPGDRIPMSPVPPEWQKIPTFRMIPNKASFSEMFPNNSFGLDSWVNHTLAGSSNPMSVATHLRRRPYLFSNWGVSKAYVKVEAYKRQIAKGAYRENDFMRMFVIVHDTGKVRYEEFRRTVNAPLNEDECHLRDQYVNFSRCPRITISPNIKYRLRSTQCYEVFANIENQEMVYHRHDGEIGEESQASARVIFTPRGVYCFRCGIFYVVEESEDSGNDKSTTTCSSCGTNKATFSKNQIKKRYHERKCKLCVEQLMEKTSRGKRSRRNEDDSCYYDYDKEKADYSKSKRPKDDRERTRQLQNSYIYRRGFIGRFKETADEEAKQSTHKETALLKK